MIISTDISFFHGDFAKFIVMQAVERELRAWISLSAGLDAGRERRAISKMINCREKQKIAERA